MQLRMPPAHYSLASQDSLAHAAARLEYLLESKSLAFPEDIETRFREEYNAQALVSTRSTAVVTLGVVILFALLDRWALPIHHSGAFTLRVLLQALPAVALFALTFWPGFARHLQYCVGIGLMLGSLATLLIIGHAAKSEWAFYLYPFTLAQVISIAYTGSRLRFPWTVAVGAFILSGYLFVSTRMQYIWSQPDGGILFALVAIFLLAINAISAMSCLNSERMLRRNYLQQRLIEVEHERAESLLNNVLPAPIAQRLKRQEFIADTIPKAGVLFADITQFTRLATRSQAAQVVMLLDILFTRFDALADQHGVEKIKTIGDAYMVASGVPNERTEHAQALARMALDMLHTIKDLQREHPEFNVRIGMACGPVVAGVIGRKRLIYDLWGDTVNLASRMESHGLPGEIQVDAETCRQLSDGFVFEKRADIKIKGKGIMTTYLLKGERAPQLLDL